MKRLSKRGREREWTRDRLNNGREREKEGQTECGDRKKKREGGKIK